MNIRIVGVSVLLILAVALLLLIGSGPSGPDRSQPLESGPIPAGEAPEESRPGLKGDVRSPSAELPDRTELISYPQPVDLEARDRDLDLFGIVVDQSGAPIPGATIETVRHPWRRTTVMNVEGYSESKPGPGTRAAVDGTFSLRLRRGQRVELRVSEPGYSTGGLAACQAGERVRLALWSAVTLTVVTTDDTGAPAEGVSLRLWRRHGAPTSFGERTGITDASGRCVFDDMEPGEINLAAQHNRLGSPNWSLVDVASEGTTTFELTMPTGRMIRGQVTDANTDRPLPAAKVGVGWTMRRFVLTDEEGQYELPGFSGEGVDDLHVTAEGYGRQGKTVPDSDRLDFALAPGDEASGRVLDGRRQPVEGALVSAVASESQGSGQEIDSRSTVSGPDGSFHLTSLRRDLPHFLVIQAPGHGRYLLDFPPHPGQPGMIELGDVLLPSPRSIEGVVIGDDGTPLAGMQVNLGGHNPDRRRLMTGPPPQRWEFYGRSESRRTDDLGRFRFPDLSPGAYKLTVRPPRQRWIEAEVALPQQSDVSDLVLVVPTGRQIDLRVILSTGEPIQDAWVNLSLPGGVGGQTDADGRIHFSGLPAREVLVTASKHPLFAGATVTARPEDRELTITLRERVSISGFVVDSVGVPLAGYQVLMRRTDQTLSQAVESSDDGSFTIHAEVGARMDLLVTGLRRTLGSDGRETRAQTAFRGELKDIVAPSSQLMIVAREVPLDGTLLVRVVDPDGSPVPSAGIHYQNAGPPTRFGRRVVADEDGRARLEGLTVEAIVLWATPARTSPSWAASKSINLLPDGQSVTLTLRVGVALSGTVVNANGLPAAEVYVVASHPAEAWKPTARTGKDGRFTLRLPATRAWLLMARDRTGQRETKLENVTPGAGDILLHFPGH